VLVMDGRVVGRGGAALMLHVISKRLSGNKAFIREEVMSYIGKAKNGLTG